MDVDELIGDTDDVVDAVFEPDKEDVCELLGEDETLFVDV